VISVFATGIGSPTGAGGQGLIVKLVEILGPVLDEITEEKPEPEFEVVVILLRVINPSFPHPIGQEFCVPGTDLRPHIPLRELDGCI